MAKADQIRKKAGEIALIKASIENIQSNITDKEKTLTEATTEKNAVKEELEQYRSAFEEKTEVDAEMNKLAPWIEKEKQLPVWKERLSNAAQRAVDLDQQIEELNEELLAKQAELSQEVMKTTGMAEKQAEVDGLNAKIEIVDGEIKVIQMDIGALTQKLEQIEKLKKEI